MHKMVAEVRAAGGKEFEEQVAAALRARIAEDTEAYKQFHAAVRAVAGWVYGGAHVGVA